MTDEKPRNLIWDTLVELFGEPRMPASRALYGKVCKEFMTGEYTRGEMLAAAHEYQRQWPQAAFTITAFAKWSDHFLSQTAAGKHAKPAPKVVSLDEVRRMEREA